MNTYKVTFQPANKEVLIPGGLSLKDAMLVGNLNYDFPCGGNGTCGKCRVKLLYPITQPCEKDIELLNENEIGENIRLACHTVISGNMEVLLVEDTLKNVLIASADHDFVIKPLVYKRFVKLTPPSLHDQSCDWQRLKESLGSQSRITKSLKIQLPLLRLLTDMLRDCQFSVTAVSDGDEIYGIEKHDTCSTCLGMAFDIGTTTVVGYLMDLATGKELSVVSALNSQVRFGADVITRTAYAKQENGLNGLHALIVTLLQSLLEEATEKAAVNTDDIYALTFVGNTCMHHLLLGLNPKNIALSPYIPVFNDAINIDPAGLNIKINPAGRAFILPNISGYVGSDTVAVILATDIYKSADIKLAIDIGTNGEIVLGSRNRLLTCSTAAGPAFEGANISCGMRGVEGAIDHISFDKKLSYSVIGEGKAKGICGSALVDAVAGLLKLGIINFRGQILSPDQLDNPAAQSFIGNIIRLDGSNAFLLVDSLNTAHGEPILITQDDVRALQLAKGALAAGIQVLIEKLRISVKDINEVFLAGAFGNYMDPHNACVIGLIPGELENKIKPVGNAAGLGAKMALLSRHEFNRAKGISTLVEYVELGAYHDFNSIFARQTRFSGFNRTDG